MFPETVPTLTTERLILRQAQVTDAPKVCESISVSIDNFKKYLNTYPRERTVEEQAEEYTQLLTKEGYAKEWRYLAFDKSNPEVLIACLGLHFIDPNVPKFEIGYWVDIRHTGKGYIIEAAKALVKLAFELGAERIQIVCAKSNVKSQAIPKKLGFELEAILKNDQRLPDKTLDSSLIFCKVKS